MPAPTPPVIPEAFAQSGDRATIPDIAGFVGRASWSLGFPPITMIPKVSDGIPPDGRDFNGVLWQISAHAFYTQAGQPFTYNIDVSNSITGYGLGALLGSSDGNTLWYNLLAGNTADPDGAGTNWVSAFTYGSINISGLAGGTRTLTRLESRFGLIVLSGALVSNQSVVLPNDIREWRIVNNTTGAFTVTIRTSGGTGVTAPQGGFTAGIGVYGNGTDIFLDVQPVALPIAVTPDPNTLLKRDNTGDAFARYFNGSSSPESISPIGNVIVTNNSDGYFRKITFGNLLVQALNNAALTGTPTAPTPAVGDSSTKVATTAFVNGIGVGGPAQSWQSVIGSRSIGTTYTNSTGLPIMVSISASLNATGDVSLFVNGVEVARMDGSSVAATEKNQICAIVPAGNTYQITAASGTIISVWAELR